MPRPWTDPLATGIGNLSGETSFREDALRYIRYLRGESDRRLAHFPTVRDAVLDFAEDHLLQVIIDHWPDCERWSLEFDYSHLHRSVSVDLVSPEDDRGKATLEVRSAAVWCDLPANKYWPPKVDCRKFTLHIACPTAIVRETLELAYADARRYTTDDLAYPDST